MAIADIFGPTPEELEYQRGQEQEKRSRQEYLAKLPNYGSELGMYAGVARAGLETGEKLRGLRLFGESPSPEMERATVMKQILKTYQGQDMSNPDVLAKMSQELGQQGYPREAMQLMEQAKSAAAGTIAAQRKAQMDDLTLQEKQANILKLQKEAEGLGVGDKMTGKMIDEFIGKAEVANSYAGLSSSFESGFAGFKSNAVGEAYKLKARNFPTSESDGRLTDWWMRYQEQVNAVRNALFGSALTETERVEFEKAMITSGMDSATAKRNLETQARVLRESYNKRLKAHEKHGWSISGLEDYVNKEGASSGSTAGASGQGDWSIEVME